MTDNNLLKNTLSIQAQVTCTKIQTPQDIEENETKVNKKIII